MPNRSPPLAALLPAALVIVLLLAACIPQQLRDQLDADRAERNRDKAAVAALTLKVEAAAKANAADLADLKAQLGSAQAKLDAAEAKLAGTEAKAKVARAESVDFWTGKVQDGTTAASPIAGTFFPLAIPLLGLAGGIAGLVRGTFGTKKEGGANGQPA